MIGTANAGIPLPEIGIQIALPMSKDIKAKKERTMKKNLDKSTYLNPFLWEEFENLETLQTVHFDDVPELHREII